MLPLTSSSKSNDNGSESRAKYSMGWSTPSSRTRKSARSRLPTTCRPLITWASTRTIATPARNTAVAGICALGSCAGSHGEANSRSRSFPMKSIIVGTEGHIDHGKTSLVRALTGIDTDRLAEEKRRGISIDLGFAHLDLGPDFRI